MKTVIMAGGKGTRIAALYPDIPKPLIPISDGKDTKPVLQWEIESLRDQGYDDFIITASHMADRIIDCFGNGSRLGVSIDYFVEDVPLGNAGALFKLHFTSDFLLINADVVFDVDINRMVRFHQEKGALATLFTHPNSHPYDSGIVIADSDGAVLSWLTKEDERPEYYKNSVNAGIHILNPELLSLSGIDPDAIGTAGPDGKIMKVDLDRQLLKPLCGRGVLFSYPSPEYVKDMGTPERFMQVSTDFAAGRVHARNLKYPQRAIFLDRDGTINEYVGFLRSPDELKLIPGAADAIKLINSSEFLAIVATNQPVIARGEVTVPELNKIHDKLETLLGNEGAYIDALYYCPHHPHKGYAGEIEELKINCTCRKPKPGMLLRAAEEYHIDLSKSWMIGDREEDIRAGKGAGCRTALIGIEDFGQNISADSLLDAVNKILFIEGQK